MKILIVTQNFWPENFGINNLCLSLKEHGHEITILTGKPNYPKGDFYEGYTFFNKSVDYWNGIKVYRSPVIPRKKGGSLMLFLNFFSFALFASIKIFFLKGTFDKIFVYAPSPITVAIPAIIGKKIFKAPIYIWVQDLWPASVSAAGGIKNKYVLDLIDHLTKYIYSRCKKILVQSKAFCSYIEKQNVPSDKIIYYPNSAEDYYKILPPEKRYMSYLPKGGVNLIFAGNIGHSQSFDTLIEAALILKKKSINVNWVIIGNGRMKDFYKKKVTALKLNDRFIFLGGFPSEEMPYFFSCADALIVSLKKEEIFSLTIPSKIQSYMACGKPIIASLDGEGARVISEAKAGFASEANNYEALSHNIIDFINMSENDKHQLGVNARLYYDKEFDREVLLDKLERILNL